MTTADSRAGTRAATERRYKLRPDEERKPHPSHAFGAQLNDRRDEIHRAEERRRDEEMNPTSQSVCPFQNAS